MAERAAAQGAELSGPAGAALLERCGEDPYLLENEVDKLSAAAGYRTITPALVAEMGVVSLEADVFEMVRLVTARSTAAACKKLHILLRLEQEPIAITAALIGSYVDLYRVKLGQQAQEELQAPSLRTLATRAATTGSNASAQTAAGLHPAAAESLPGHPAGSGQKPEGPAGQPADPAGDGPVPSGDGRGAADERARAHPHQPGAGGGGQVRRGPPGPPDRRHDPAHRGLCHLFGQEAAALLKELAAQNGLILLTDSDRAGFQIRTYITNLVGAEHVAQAYVPALPGKERRKAAPGKEGLLGWRGCRTRSSAGACWTPSAPRPAPPRALAAAAGRPVTYGDLYDWGLSGTAGAAERKYRLLAALGLPPRLSKKEMLEVFNRLYTLNSWTGWCGAVENQEALQ